MTERNPTTNNLRDARGGIPTAWDSKAELFVAYSEYLDPENPRESFEEYLTDRAEHFPEVEYYLEHGSWRDDGHLTGDARKEIIETVFNQQPNNCYYNSQSSMVSDRMYVEGYVITDSHVPAPHAWFEVEEGGVSKIVEITPPWVEKSPENVDYFGVKFHNKVVRQAMMERGTADPIVETVIEQDEAEKR